LTRSLYLPLKHRPSGPSSYTSDSDVYRGYTSDCGGGPGRALGLEDGYRSEGGAELGSRRAGGQRAAYEQQRAAAEAEHRRFLDRHPGRGEGGRPGGYTELPSVLGRPGSYRLQSGRRNVQKTDSGEGLPSSPHPALILEVALMGSSARLLDPGE
jgi:hypothetical protein